mgnify:CR=1 FL=1
MSTLYIMIGFSGTGKSTAANILSKETGAEVHKSDCIRKEIASGDPTYSKQESQNVYNELFSRGESDLRSGNDVVLDATFTLKVGRDRAECIANKTNSTVTFIHVTCDDSVVRTRLKNRTNSESDAGVDVYESQKRGYEEITREYTEVDNSGTMSTLQNQIMDDVIC